MTPVLLDSWALIALMDRKDAGHLRAVRLSKRLRAAQRKRVVTEWVLAEFLGYAADLRWRSHAISTVEHLRQAADVQIIAANSADWQLGFDLYKSRADKEWSLVDCISILLCQRLGIPDVFSGDHHFEQAGLQILIR